MDLITLDVSEVPKSVVNVGTSVDLIGERINIGDIARRAGTISYEILTALGNRYHHRVSVDEDTKMS